MEMSKKKKIIRIALIILITATLAFIGLIFFAVYPSFIHNQYFSKLGRISQKIKPGLSCNQAYSLLHAYYDSNDKKSEMVLTQRKTSEFPELEHRKESETIIVMHDPTTIFDDINFYVFCSKDKIVIDTLFVGD